MLTVPNLVILATLYLAYHEMSKPSRTKSTPECQSKYCHQTWVDRPKNTLLKDQSRGAGLGPSTAMSLREPYQTVANDYHQEQVMHPGVRLVAHAIA